MTTVYFLCNFSIDLKLFPSKEKLDFKNLSSVYLSNSCLQGINFALLQCYIYKKIHFPLVYTPFFSISFCIYVHTYNLLYSQCKSYRDLYYHIKQLFPIFFAPWHVFRIMYTMLLLSFFCQKIYIIFVLTNVD